MCLVELLVSSVRKDNLEERLMAVKSIFISFDYDHDNELRGSFISEAQHHSKHKFVDYSFSSAVDGRWKKEARTRIGQTDFVIFLCGANTHAAPGVEAEMTITQQLKKPYFLLRGRRNSNCSKPRSARASDKMQPRKWKHINSLLDG